MEKLPANNNQSNGVVEANSASIFQHNQKDTKIVYLSERAKKLVTAVYLVTNLISGTDPLRQNIREFAIKVLSLMGRTPAGQSLSDVHQEVSVLVRKIVEMLEVAFFSGYVSEMNFSVLKTEFDLFIEEMVDYENSQGVLSADSLRSSLNPGGFPAGSNPALSASSASHAAGYAKVGKSPLGGTPSINKGLNQPVKKNVVEAKKNSRREAILSIMRRRGEVNIKDISSVVINCSEKTIQRELLELVESGIVKKKGERRWSIYSLA
jgi:DNA-binding transcriptional ArsR family regulator